MSLRQRWTAAIGIVACAAAAACSVPAKPSFPEVAAAVEQRTGHRIFWNQGGEADAEVEKAIRSMLQRELTAAEAVQIALLNNRTLQATYEELTIAKADVVQAGLLKNPVFLGSVRVAVDRPLAPVLDFDVEQDFLGILMIPAKKRLASAAFEAAKLRVGHQVVDLTYEVRASYFSLQAALQVAAMRQTILEAAQASFELATRQHEAGNINDADLASEQALYEQTRVDVVKSRMETLTAREKLARLMGVWGADAAFSVAGRLPDLPPQDPTLEHAESTAIAKRLDVAAARHDLQARSYALAMTRNWRWLGDAAVGAHFEKEPDGTFLGPSARIEVPLFDQKQAAIARLEAELNQSRSRLGALSVEARSQVREARGRVLLARELAERYRTVIVPLREQLVRLMQQQYDAMLIGVYQLLAAKQNEVNAYREYIEAVRDYWVARSDLDRAAGGRLTGPVAAVVRPIDSPPPAPAEHHHP